MSTAELEKSSEYANDDLGHHNLIPSLATICRVGDAESDGATLNS